MPDGRATSKRVPEDHGECAAMLKRSAAELGLDAVVSTERPVVETPYSYVDGALTCFTCPHGVTFYLEPTSEQIAQWAAEGVS